MAPLHHGLNIQKKGPPGRPPPGATKKRTIFDDDEDDDGNDVHESVKTTTDDAEEITVFGENGISSSTTKPLKIPNSESLKLPNRIIKSEASALAPDLSTLRTQKQRQAEAEQLDSSIYDYDSAFDALHAQDAARKQAAHEEAQQRKPKYMENLLAAADVRKRDQLRAEDRLRQKEREAEGEQFKETEEFVTEAYKKQQEELKRIAEEEKVKEEKEAEKRRKAGMGGFYRKVMEEEEKRHAEAVEAAKNAVNKADSTENALPQEDDNEEKSAAEEARALNAAGAKVVINEEGQVTDKRQLLSAGLNIAPKRKLDGSGAGPSPVAQRPVQRHDQRDRAAEDGKRAMRERQSRMIEAQLEQAAKKAAEDEAEDRAKMERAAKSRKTEGDISSARERYLQRKKEAAAAAVSRKEK